VQIKVALAAVATALAVAGAACTPDPDPSPVPTTPSATPITTPPPPVLPATARADSPAGAESFARYYMGLLDYAYQTGNTTPLRAAARCQGCDALAAGIDKSYAAGNRIQGGRIAVNNARTSKYATKASASVQVTYSSAARKVVAPTGKVTEVPGEDNVRLLLTLKRFEQGWLLVNAQPIE
jgi:hypothetical protein